MAYNLFDHVDSNFSAIICFHLWQGTSIYLGIDTWFFEKVPYFDFYEKMDGLIFMLSFSFVVQKLSGSSTNALL